MIDDDFMGRKYSLEGYFNKENPSWFKLDNAAKIYPAIRSAKRSNVFRVSVVLKEIVDPNILEQALKTILLRFPSFTVRMRRGLFWYYMEHNCRSPLVLEDTGSPCRTMNWKDNNRFLFKVLYYNRRISIEFFHSLTDGTGAMEFLKALCAQYLSIKGYDIEKSDSILDIDSLPLLEEVQDSFLQYAIKGNPTFSRESKAYHPVGTLDPSGMIHVTTGILDVDALLAISHSMNVSITEYLTAVLMYVIYLHQQEHSYRHIKPVKVSVPVNLRKHFESRTLRNFSLYVNPGIDSSLGKYTFEEIVLQVHHFMRYSVNSKLLRAQMSANVSAERNLAMRIMPLFMKNLSLSIAFNLLGDSRVSSTLTNVGKIVVPESMAKRIERFEAMLSSTFIKPVNCAVVSHLNTLVINFTRIITESDIEREFFRFLVSKGLHIKIESNDI